jgi:hypothetical protein
MRRIDFNPSAHDEEAYADLCRLSEEVEQDVRNRVSHAMPIDTWTQQTRGWLRYFAHRAHFNAYRIANARAKPPIAAAMRQRWPNAHLRLSFQPMSSLFGVEQEGNWVCLTLPTPMFTFDRQAFAVVSQVALLGGGPNELRIATSRPNYRAVQAELDALGTEGLAPALPVSDTRAAAESGSRRRDLRRGA